MFFTSKKWSRSVCVQVFQALFQFDSRATALLFKDLSKAGVGQRAVELFDWLRKLEEGHALRPLCDVYTYTAMIAQCIYQQVRTRGENYDRGSGYPPHLCGRRRHDKYRYDKWRM